MNSILISENRINLRGILPSPFTILLWRKLSSHLGSYPPMLIEHHFHEATIAALGIERRHDDASRIRGFRWNILSIESHCEPVVYLISHSSTKRSFGEIAKSIYSRVYLFYPSIRRKTNDRNFVDKQPLQPDCSSVPGLQYPKNIPPSYPNSGKEEKMRYCIRCNLQRFSFFRHPRCIRFRVIRFALKYRKSTERRTRIFQRHTFLKRHTFLR